MDEVEQLKAAVQEMMAGLQAIGGNPPAEVLQAVTQALGHVQNRIASLQQAENATVPLPVPENAKLLWILSGGMPEVFQRYLSQYPGRGLLELAQDPNQFNRITAQLQQLMPQGQAREEDGVPKSPLQSSNIYGFLYDRSKGQLLVRFNQGSIYKYDGVPPVIAQLFGVGAGTAKTSGKNEWGSWWKGKNPSMGAALNQLIKAGGYSYQKIKD